MGRIRRFIDRFRPSKIIRREIDAAMYRWTRDIEVALRFRAIMDSADFVSQNIPLHKRFDGPALRTICLKLAPPEGLLLEFGVWQGGSINFFADATDRQIYGFDSFEGLPEPWTMVNAGFFKVDKLPKVRENVTLIKGWFNESLPIFLERHRDKVAFIHMDCDLYSSTKTVLELLKDRIVAGTTILLDDFLMQPGWQREEHKAWLDFVATYQVEFEYLGYQTGWSSAVAVQVKKSPNLSSK